MALAIQIMGCDMTELSPQLTAEQASRRIATDIRAYPHNGPDKREEHLRLFGGLLSHGDIEGAWADRYAAIALAGRDRLADLTARLAGLRPKIEEAKHILAQKKIVGFRRYAKREQSSANVGVSFLYLRHNLRLMKRERTRQRSGHSLSLRRNQLNVSKLSVPRTEKSTSAPRMTRGLAFSIHPTHSLSLSASSQFAANTTALA